MSGIVYHVVILLPDKESALVVQETSMAAHYRDIATSSGTAVRLHFDSRKHQCGRPLTRKTNFIRVYCSGKQREERERDVIRLCHQTGNL